MNILGAIIDRFVLVALIVGAGAAPSFMHQYRQQVGGRLAQVQTDLAGFRAIAQRRHGGDMDALVAYHLASTDDTFYGEGQVIATMVERAQELAVAYAALDAPLAGQAWYLLRASDPQIVRATWTLFEPSFALTPPGIVFALVVGVGAWLLMFFLWRLCRAILVSVRPLRSAAR